MATIQDKEISILQTETDKIKEEIENLNIKIDHLIDAIKDIRNLYTPKNKTIAVSKSQDKNVVAQLRGGTI